MNQVLYFILNHMPEILLSALILAIVYQLKHFLADYVFQTDYMLKKGNLDWSFFAPLFSHTLVHGGMTFLIAWFFLHNLKWALILMAFDTFIHFVMDRLKASPRYLGRFQLQPSGSSRENHLFWVTFGFDQMIHHLTHLCIIAAMLYLAIKKS